MAARPPSPAPPTLSVQATRQCLRRRLGRWVLAVAGVGEGGLVEGEWRVGRPRGFGETAGVEPRAREERCIAASAAGAGTGTWVGSSRSTRPRGVRGRNQRPAGPRKLWAWGRNCGCGAVGLAWGTSVFPSSKCVLVLHESLTHAMHTQAAPGCRCDQVKGFHR